jgi:hypothetical protein
MEEVLCKAKDLAEAAGKKTGELMTLTKLKLELADTGRAIASLMEKIGRETYAAYKGEETNADDITAYVEQVDVLQEKAEDLAAQIDELRRTRSCAACGKNNTQDAVYCQNCGEKL